jgi:hypothetical protein
MLDSTVELLARFMFISFCFVGSIVLALRAHQRVTDEFHDQPERSM